MSEFGIVIADILKERVRQDKKWGANRVLPDFTWNAILTEEVGEAAKEVLEVDVKKLRVELIQVAAVAVAWIESLDRRKGAPDA